MISRSTMLSMLAVVAAAVTACGGNPTAPSNASLSAQSAGANAGGAVTTEAKAPAAPTSCAVPAGELTLHGIVSSVSFIATPSGLLPQNFDFVSDAGVSYHILTNYYDGSAPLTQVLNLSCKASPAQFVSLGLAVTVTGTPTAKAATLHASVVQVPTKKDKL
jgi:hypothetical protein